MAQDTVVSIPAADVALEADLAVPDDAQGIVLFAHGSGSSRHSPRNRMVAERLHQAGLATVLADLLTDEEEAYDRATAALRFDIGLLAERVAGAVDWLRQQPQTERLPLGLFGASTGAAAALVAAAHRAPDVRAVVSRGGRPDLAGNFLPRVQAPTLLIVGSRDEQVVELNKRAAAMMRVEHELRIVPGATHLFEEPGALEEVGSLAAEWFEQHLTPSRSAGVPISFDG
jgi:dienelactone hydrolase